MRFLAFWTPFAAFGFMLRSPAIADDHPSKGEMVDFKIYSDIKWIQGPPSLPKGVMMAVLEGNPAKEGLFVFRVKLPDGYRVPPHTHPKIERVTVISGTFNIGMGDIFDEKATKAMPAGTYGYWPAGMKHFVWAKGETVLQFHGMGPWSIQFVNPNDDPRKKDRDSTRQEVKPVIDAVKGDWVLVGTDDEKRSDRGDDNCRMSIRSNGEVILRIGELTTNSGVILVRRVGKSDEIDLKLKSGNVVGVFERKGNSLVICCDFEANGRPNILAPMGSQWKESWRLASDDALPCIRP